MTYYRRSIVTMGLSRTVSEIKRRFRSKIAKFSHPRVFCAPLKGFEPLGIGYRRRRAIFTFVAFCYKHICISRIVTQNTLKCAISRAKFLNFSGEGHSPSQYPTPVGRGHPLPTPYPLVAFGHSPPPSRNPGSATGARHGMD